MTLTLWSQELLYLEYCGGLVLEKNVSCEVWGNYKERIRILANDNINLK
ncbi:hypothetical protein J4416_04935 [Candidatus Pacearchaeota archaeon]|nr:hypothetical protein [Candidatus Pacearchaeota archaeon]